MRERWHLTDAQYKMSYGVNYPVIDEALYFDEPREQEDRDMFFDAIDDIIIINASFISLVQTTTH